MRLTLVTAAVAGLLVATAATAVHSVGPTTVEPAAAECTKDAVAPDAGQLSLTFKQPSTQNPDRDDYHMTGTIRWDSQAKLDCYAKGRIDWAYEHEIVYGKHFDRKLWNVYLGFPADADAYVDTTASDQGDLTTLSIGVGRPERLRAGSTYTFSYDLLLPRLPRGERQPVTLEWEVDNKQCPWQSTWCVGLSPWGGRSRGTLIGTKRDGFGSRGEGPTCWAWRLGKDPSDCTPPPHTTSPRVPTGSAPTSTTAAPPPPTSKPTAAPPPPTKHVPLAPPTTEKPAPPPQPVSATTAANGCNSYGGNCDNNPLYSHVPPPGYNWKTWPTNTRVPNGTPLLASCWVTGGVTTNYASWDPGPHPYGSNVYYLVTAPDGTTGYVPDTYSARDSGSRLGLAPC